MDPRLTVVTLGVADLGRARAFYEELGWRSESPREIGVVFFASGDMVLSLWGRDELARDSGVAPGEGWGGVTLAHNVGSEAEVDRLIAAAESAGATITRAPGETFWGDWDQRHTVNAYAAYRFSARFSASTRFRYGSNFPATGYWETRSGQNFVSSVRNALRGLPKKSTTRS